MDIVKELNQLNDVKIYSIFDEEFSTYGKVVEGYDFSELIDYMNSNTSIPDDGNIYIASDEGLEKFSVAQQISKEIYGNMAIQVGYCNGKNSTYNGFEYHKCSEINIAVTDFVLALGHSYEIRDNHYDNDDAVVFFVPKGYAVELYQTTLHLSPLKVTDDGFKNIVILANGTNTPLAYKPSDETGENRLLLQKNKWVISHPDRMQLISQGAYPGIIGENKEIKYK